jgi:hypothetical protein
MELRQLRYFVAVARERNFTRAAELLHSDLELEDVMPTEIEHPFRLFDVPRCVVAGQGPGDRQLVALATAEQFRHRQSDTLGLGFISLNRSQISKDL